MEGRQEEKKGWREGRKRRKGGGKAGRDPSKLMHQWFIPFDFKLMI